MTSNEGSVPSSEIPTQCGEAEAEDFPTTPKEDSQDELSEEMEKLVIREKEESLLTNEDREDLKVQALQYKNSSNQQFQRGEFQEAKEGYTKALDTCPLVYMNERAIFFSNRAACLSYLEECEAAIKDCSEAIKLNPGYLKPLKRRAELYEKTDKLDESLADFKLLLEKDPRDRDAVLACQRLPPLINERNEKLKTEMMGKLKDLGNLVLKPFGLSTENFQFQQNEAGGYSVNFKQ